MKKVVKVFFSFVSVLLGVLVLAFLFKPFYEGYINAGHAVGADYLMHLSNLEYFYEHGRFPISDWQATWFGGYPVIEGYPYLHYYLMKPVVSLVGDAATAMEYYAIATLFLYFVASFGLFYYVCKNFPLALFLTTILLYGADSGMALFEHGFVTFSSSQLFLPLVLLAVIAARQRKSSRLWVLVG